MITSYEKLRSEYELQIKKYCLAEIELQKRKDMISACSAKMQEALASVQSDIDEYSGMADRIELLGAEDRIASLELALREIILLSRNGGRCFEIATEALDAK